MVDNVGNIIHFFRIPNMLLYLSMETSSRAKHIIISIAHSYNITLQYSKYLHRIIALCPYGTVTSTKV